MTAFALSCTAQPLTVDDLFVLVDKTKTSVDSLMISKGYNLMEVDVKTNSVRQSLFWSTTAGWIDDGHQVLFEYVHGFTHENAYYFWNRKEDRIEDAGISFSQRDSLSVRSDIRRNGLVRLTESNPGEEYFSDSKRNLFAFIIKPKFPNSPILMSLIKNTSPLFSKFLPSKHLTKKVRRGK
jgi:hypothetical protein